MDTVLGRTATAATMTSPFTVPAGLLIIAFPVATVTDDEDRCATAASDAPVEAERARAASNDADRSRSTGERGLIGTSIGGAGRNAGRDRLEANHCHRQKNLGSQPCACVSLRPNQARRATCSINVP